MTRVIHTGDTHLGYRQYHSPQRRRDFLAAFESVVDDAIDDDVDAVVHAGDLFHDRQPSLPDVHGAIEVLRTLRDASIPFLAIVGNHERTRDQQWLDLFETLGLATRLGREPVEIGDTSFYGLDYVPRSKREDLAYDFEPSDASSTALVAHGLFEPFAYADWDTERVLAEATVDFDVMLLGDNHEPDRAEVNDTWVTYCGSTERTEAGERDDRGYNVIEFGEEVSIRRRGLDTRDFVFRDISLSPGEGAERVRERLREEDLEDAVVVVRIDGDGDDVPIAALESFATDRGALVARVTDHREFESAEIEEVRFAEPDDAVRERLREMGPSEAALGLDETIRDDAVADANVRDHATAHVRDLLESNPGAFTGSVSVDDVAERVDSAAFDDASTDRASTAPDPPGADPETTDADDEPSETDSDVLATDSDPDVDLNGQQSEAVAGESVDATADGGDADSTSDDGEEESAETAEEDGQVTMEDYL